MTESISPNLRPPLSPDRTAILVVDVQNDFLHDQGHFARSGRSVRAMQAITPNIDLLVDTARRSEAMVIFVQQTTLPDGLSDSPAWRCFKTRDGKSPDYTIDGTWGQELFGSLRPTESEPTIKKFRPSAFHETGLASLLRANDIDTVVTCGVLTQGCVLATVLDASFHDFFSCVAVDAVQSTDAEQHEVSLHFLASRYDLIEVKSLEQKWA